jgi:hypothetical protein
VSREKSLDDAIFDRARTVPINVATAADHTLHTPQSDRRWMLLDLYLQAEGNVDATFKSGSTAVSGAIALTTSLIIDRANQGLPIMAGRTAGQALVLTLSGAVQVNGWATVIEGV